MITDSTFVSQHELAVKYSIQNYDTNGNKRINSSYSKTTEFVKATCKLRFYPYGRDQNPDKVIFTVNIYFDGDITLGNSSKLLVIRPDNSVFGNMSFTDNPTKSNQNKWRFSAMFEKAKFLSTFPSKDKFFVKFHCSIQQGEKLRFVEANELKIPAKFREIMEQHFRDVKISVERKIIHAHKLLISAYSPVLYQESIKIRTQAASIKITNISLSTMMEVINFIYDKPVDLNDTNAKDIMLAAKLLQIDSLLKICEKWIYQKLTNVNALDTLSFCYRHEIAELQQETMLFATFNYQNISVGSYKKLLTECPQLFVRVLFENVVRQFYGRMKAVEPYQQMPCNLSDPNTSLSSDLGNLIDNMQFWDVILRVEGKDLKAHKDILSCRSAVFRAMFAHKTLELAENVVTITDCDYETMKEALTFIYSGRLVDIKKNAMKLFVVGDKYDIKDLKESCKTFLMNGITQANVFETLELAEMHQCKDLKAQAKKFVRINILKLMESQPWKDFAVNNPILIFEMFVEWFKFTLAYNEQ